MKRSKLKKSVKKAKSIVPSTAPAGRVDDEAWNATLALRPSFHMARSFDAFATPSELGKPERVPYLVALVEQLDQQCNDVHSGDLRQSESLLMNQANCLNSIFAALAFRAAANLGEYRDSADIYLRLALKAQTQCRATLETLSNIKNPPIVYAKQANFAQGHQQVNNASAESRGNESEIRQSKLLEKNDGKQWLDTRAPCAASEGNPSMATVGEINGAANKRWKGGRGPK